MHDLISCFPNSRDRVTVVFQNRKRYGGMHDINPWEDFNTTDLGTLQNRKRYGGMHDLRLLINFSQTTLRWLQNRKRYGGMHDSY